VINGLKSGDNIEKGLQIISLVINGSKEEACNNNAMNALLYANQMHSFLQKQDSHRLNVLIHLLMDKNTS